MADANKTLITLENLGAFKTNYDSQIGYTGTEVLMTQAEKTKLTGIAEGAQVNVLEGVQVNGSDLPVTAKKVNIDLSNYALKSDIVDGVRFKGVVENYEALPSSEQKKGDIYIITTADPTHEIVAGEAVIWDGEAWQDMGGTMTVDLSNYYNKGEADGRFAPIVHTHTVSQITDLESWFTGKDVVTNTALTAALGSYYTKTDADGKFQTKAGMTDYVAKSEFASQLAAAGGYDSTNNPVATEEQITALFE